MPQDKLNLAKSVSMTSRKLEDVIEEQLRDPDVSAAWDKLGFDNRIVRQTARWMTTSRNPICPYGCGEPGELKEIVMKPDGQAVGLFHDSEGLVFQADIQVVDDDSRKVKVKKTASGELRIG